MTKICFSDLAEWFRQPSPPIIETYNPPAITAGLMGAGPVEPIPPPQTLYDLASVRTPFAVLFRKPRTTLT